MGRVTSRAYNDTKRRLRKAEKEITELFSAIPNDYENVTEIQNGLHANERYYSYEMDDTRLQNFETEIHQIINRWLETLSENKPPRFFFDAYIDEAYSTGTSRSLNNMQAIAPSDVQVMGQSFSSIDIEQILFSQPYQSRLSLIRSRVFETMKGFAGQTGDDLAFNITNGMAAGESPLKIKKVIRDRFSVSDSRAERIARTEVNRAYTDARLDMNKQAREDLGLNTAVMHVSALAPTSRRAHVARSGNVYTPEAQRKWWNSDSNRINCLCTAVEVMLDDDGNVLNTKAQEIIKKEKKEYLD